MLRCSVTLITEGKPLSRAASGAPGQALDDLQYSAGQGPGLEAARTRELVTVQDLPADARWPELADCARAQGVHSVAAIPLDVRRSSVGSVSLFVARPHGIVPDLLLTAMAIVSQAEILLGELGRRAALREGATVDRAAGVIIAQRGCGVREAYEVLRDTAQRLGMDRRAVAERLIAARPRPGPAPPDALTPRTPGGRAEATGAELAGVRSADRRPPGGSLSTETTGLAADRRTLEARPGACPRTLPGAERCPLAARLIADFRTAGPGRAGCARPSVSDRLAALGHLPGLPGSVHRSPSWPPARSCRR